MYLGEIERQQERSHRERKKKEEMDERKKEVNGTEGNNRMRKEYDRVNLKNLLQRE
jgi:hypothetical protein